MTPVTIRDVAREAGVSPGTVSRAMNDSPLVSSETRQRVLEVVQTLNYSPNLTARKLSLGKTLTISVILPFLTRPSYIERLNGVVAALTPSQYDMVIHSVQTPEQRQTIFEDVIRRERSDGVLIISLPPMDSEVDFLANADIPITLIDAIHPELKMLDQVFIDDIEGGKMATRHLIDLGHKKIGYIGDIYNTPFRFSSNRDRYHGYRLALEEAGLPFVENYYAEDEHGRLEAKHMARQMLSQSNPPTAIFAYSDTTAWGVMEAAQELGIVIPDDFSLIGFDNIEIAEYLKITTIYQPLFDSGQLGMQLLLEKLENPNKTAVQEQQDIQLITRQTTSTPK